MASDTRQSREFVDQKLISSVISALNNQRLCSKLCDVIVRISGHELHAHSNVLAASSPYFDNLFSEPPRSFSQKSPQIIEIHIDGGKDTGYGDAVQRIVEFMYTARIWIDFGLLPQIMEIAKIMQMQNITEFCDTLQGNITSTELVLQTDLQARLDSEANSEEKQTLKKECSDFTLFEGYRYNSDIADIDSKANSEEKQTLKENCSDHTLFEGSRDNSDIDSKANSEEKQSSKKKCSDHTLFSLGSKASSEKKRTSKKKCSDHTLFSLGSKANFEEKQISRKNCSDHTLFEGSRDNSGISEAFKFKTKLKDKPNVLYIEDHVKRKRGRGRPRKDIPEEQKVLFEQKTWPGSSVEKESEVGNIRTGEDNIRHDETAENQIKIEKEIENEQEVVCRNRIVKPKFRISRSGRVIKPKLFPDDIVPYNKEMMALDSSIQKEILDALANDENIEVVNIDGHSEISDPLYSGLDAVKEENNQNYIGHIRKYACEKCDSVLPSIKEFHEHNKEHMHAEKKCSICGWVCENGDEAAFEEHLNNHSGPKRFFCNFCNLRFKTRAQLFLHLPKHSKVKPFTCHICKAGFKWKHALKNHMITHKATKDYLCDICGFATAHKTQLKAHHLIHTGETFKCPEEGCAYQATKKTNLKFHLLTHTREKPHQCEVCGTSFSLVKNMKRHMLLHRTERPYRCEKCTFSSTRFDKLKEHYFKQHNIGEKPGKKFTWAEYLEQEEKGFEALMNPESKEEDIEIEDKMETIELEVPTEDLTEGQTQILNLTSATGESIPVAITHIGSDISYEIPVHFVVPEEANDQ